MTSGPGRREHSEQFSLKELMRLEEERVAEQARDRRAREEAARRAKEEEERRVRERAAADERAAAEERECARRAELEGLARREAMQKAAVEQARLEIEVRARAEERELERRHELELQRLRLEAKKGQLGTLAGAALLGGASMLAVVLGIHFIVLEPATDRRIAQLEGRVADGDGRAAELDRELVGQRRKNEAHERTIAEQARQIERLRHEPAPSQTATPPRRPSKPGAPHAPTTTPPPSGRRPAPTECLKGDPMCG